MTVDSLFIVVDASASISTEMPSLNVSVGDDASFSCESDTPVNWQRQLFSSSAESDRICYQGEIVKGYESEYSLDIDNTHKPRKYTLTILSADKDDAGTYTCIENAGLGPGSVSANLTVYGKHSQMLLSLFAWGCFLGLTDVTELLDPVSIVP